MNFCMICGKGIGRGSLCEDCQKTKEEKAKNWCVVFNGLRSKAMPEKEALVICKEMQTRTADLITIQPYGQVFPHLHLRLALTARRNQ